MCVQTHTQREGCIFNFICLATHYLIVTVFGLCLVVGYPFAKIKNPEIGNTHSFACYTYYLE